MGTRRRKLTPDGIVRHWRRCEGRLLNAVAVLLRPWLWDENPKIAQQVELPERWDRATISRRGYDQFQRQLVIRERLLLAYHYGVSQ